jgi:hypothetical protein
MNACLDATTIRSQHHGGQIIWITSRLTLTMSDEGYTSNKRVVRTKLNICVFLRFTIMD